MNTPIRDELVAAVYRKENEDFARQKIRRQKFLELLPELIMESAKLGYHGAQIFDVPPSETKWWFTFGHSTTALTGFPKQIAERLKELDVDVFYASVLGSYCTHIVWAEGGWNIWGSKIDTGLIARFYAKLEKLGIK